MRQIGITAILYIFLSFIIYMLIRKICSNELKYTQQLESDIQKKTLEIEKQKDLLSYRAYHDALTGLLNPTLLNDRLQQGIEKAKRSKTTLALFFIDLDNFKQVNDTLGHDAGDRVLQIVTERLGAMICKEDSMARFAGDEFVMIMSDLKDAKDASILAEKILKLSSKPIYFEGRTIFISCSIGISLYPQDDTGADNLL